MQGFIFKNKNKITLISFILIVFAFVMKLGFDNTKVFNISLIIASIIGLIPILLQAIGSLRLKIISIDVLVSIAVIGAFIIKNYEESAIVTFLFLFGAFLELKTLNKTKGAISNLVDQRPKTANKLVGKEFELVDVMDVDKDDIVLVKTGDLIPVDGIIVKGSSYVNEASITGESMPLKKNVGDEVFSGTILDNGTIEIRALKVGYDTTFSKIIELVEDAQDSKSNTEKFINKFSTYYTPVVLLIAIIVFIITKNIETSITILVLGCPGALVIGVPVSNVSGIGNGAKNGVLLKGSEVISDLSKTTTIIFDKTGTLTTGKPVVHEEISYTKDTDDALKYLLAIEKESNHPLAKAIVEHVKLDTNYLVTETNVITGFGISAIVNNKKVLVGNLNLMKSNKVKITDKALNDIEQIEIKGSSIVLVAIENELVLSLGVRDEIRKNAYDDLKELRKKGIKNLILLSGDNQKIVDIVTKELNLTKGIGNMLPKDKSDYVKMLQEEGEIVTFVGDGINDSPSIALANVGISMGSGTDVAIETSDVVLMKSDLAHLNHAVGLSKKIVNNTFQNIAIALGVVFILITGLLFSDLVSMSVGMLVHELSILVVILNGMRLLLFKGKGGKNE